VFEVFCLVVVFFHILNQKYNPQKKTSSFFSVFFF